MILNWMICTKNFHMSPSQEILNYKSHNWFWFINNFAITQKYHFSELSNQRNSTLSSLIIKGEPKFGTSKKNYRTLPSEVLPFGRNKLLNGRLPWLRLLGGGVLTTLIVDLLLRHPSGFSVLFLGCPGNIGARRPSQHRLLRCRSLWPQGPSLPARRGGCWQCSVLRGTVRRNPRHCGLVRLHLGMRWGGLETNRSWATIVMVGSFAK
jgi:hypothetical protein